MSAFCDPTIIKVYMQSCVANHNSESERQPFANPASSESIKRFSLNAVTHQADVKKLATEPDCCRLMLAVSRPKNCA